MRSDLLRKMVMFSMISLFMVFAGGCDDKKLPDLIYPQAPPNELMYDSKQALEEQLWTTNNAHDPGIIKTDEGYYVFSTDVRVGAEPTPGVMVRKSNDLIHWTWVGYALSGIPEEAKEWTGATNLWAPDIVKVGDEYRLYYSASTFGSRQSMIGLATSSSIEGPWEDQGAVIKTKKDDEINSIDANIVTDVEGKMWIVYGSFFGGIYIAPLNESTGKLQEEGFGTRIAARDRVTEDGAIEGPYIVYNPVFKQYYLFTSYDSLSSDYNVRVARSESITGPYVDFNGIEMTNTTHSPQFDVGNKIVSGYRFDEGEGWVATGHNSVLRDGDDYFIVHHARGETDKNWPYLHVRKILWTEEGWPVVSPERYAGETEQDIPEKLIAGEWERIVLEPFIDGQVDSGWLKLHKGGKLESSSADGNWSYDGKRTLTFTWDSVDSGDPSIEKLMLLPSWDWELLKPTIVFTGMNERGVAVWGKQIRE